MNTRFWWENLKGRDRVEDLCVVGRRGRPVCSWEANINLNPKEKLWAGV